MAVIQPILSVSNTQNTQPQELKDTSQSGSIWTTLSLNEEIKYIMSQMKSEQQQMQQAQNELKKSAQGTN